MSIYLFLSVLKSTIIIIIKIITRSLLCDLRRDFGLLHSGRAIHVHNARTQVAVMKLYLCISISLTHFGAALSSPLDEYLRGTFQTAYDDYVGAQDFQPDGANANAQEYTEEDVNQPPEAQFYTADMEGKIFLGVFL